MLLIGSRAIVVHFPDFRAPKDWDLIGTEEEIARLAERLPLLSTRPGDEKYLFDYGDAHVEVANSSRSAYWARVQAQFSGEPTLMEPLLGSLNLAPPAYLLLTKQCGLVYEIFHWHKNLEDLYFLRDRIPSIAPEIAELLPLALEDSRQLFGEGHARFAQQRTCEPGAQLKRHDLHARFHEGLRLGDASLSSAFAWQGFPNLSKDDRPQAMERLLAEEAMVIAAEDFLERGRSRLEQEHDFVVGAMRRLATGTLPIGWRYFCVNHFREILALVPEGFLARLGDLIDGQKAFPHGIDVGKGCDPSAIARLHPAATGGQRLPRVIGGALCSKTRSVSREACDPLVD